jgi:hypothetical protein
MIEIKVRELITENFIKEAVQENNIINWVITKEDIKNNNYSETLKLLKVLSDEGIKSEGKLGISFYGYDKNPNDVYEINKIRNYVKKLVKKYPYIFYFLTNFDNSMTVILLCILDRNDFFRTSPTYIKFKLSEDKMLEIVKPVIDYCRSINEMPENTESLICKILNIHENDLRVQSVHRAIELRYNETV